MSNLYKGKSIETWIDNLLQKVNELELANQSNKADQVINAEQVSFNSNKFRAKNVKAALDESRGLILGQLDLLNSKYNNKFTVRELLDVLSAEYCYSFNKDMLDQFDDVNQVDTISDGVNEILKIVLRLQLESDQLKKELTDLKAQCDRRANVPNHL